MDDSGNESLAVQDVEQVNDLEDTTLTAENDNQVNGQTPSENLGNSESIVVHNDVELNAALDQLKESGGIIELLAGTYHWNVNGVKTNISFIGQGSETILLPAEDNWFYIEGLDAGSGDEKIVRNFKNLVIKNAFIEMSNDVSFENILFDNVVFNIGLPDYRDHIIMNTINPSEVTYYTTFKNCNFTNTQDVLVTDSAMGFPDQIGEGGEMGGYLYQSNFASLAGKTYYMFAYPHNDINIVNCTFSNIALDVLVFADTDFGYLNIENSVIKNCTYSILTIAKTSTNDYVNINNCWYDSDVVLGFSDLGIFKTAQATDSYATAIAVQNENVVYDGETPNNFTVKLVSVNAEGVKSDFNAAGFPNIPVTFCVEGAATEIDLVEGAATLSVPLTTNETLINASIGKNVLTFTLPSMPEPIDPVKTTLNINSTEKGIVVITVVDSENKPIANIEVKYSINGGANSTNTTGVDGTISIPLTGEGEIKAYFEGNETYLKSEGSYKFNFTEANPTVNNNTSGNGTSTNTGKTTSNTNKQTTTKVNKKATKITAKKKTFKAKKENQKIHYSFKSWQSSS